MFKKSIFLSYYNVLHYIKWINKTGIIETDKWVELQLIKWKKNNTPPEII